MAHNCGSLHLVFGSLIMGGKHDRESLWEMTETRQDICNICTKPLKRTRGQHVELRPTGAGRKLQRWPYCKECWEWCQEDKKWKELGRISAALGHKPTVGGEDPVEIVRRRDKAGRFREKAQGLEEEL